MKVASKTWEKLKFGGQMMRYSNSLIVEYPLSHGQAALWFHYKLTPESAAYNLAGAAAVPAGTDLEALQCAFQMVAERHPMLRTLFAAQHGKPVQRVYSSAKVDFRVDDASKWDAAQFDDRLSEAIYCPFDLEQGPTWRVMVFKGAPLPGINNGKTDQREHLVLLVLHHIISDLWSITILLSEVAAYYRQEMTGTPAALKPLRFNFGDYVQKEQKRLSGPQAEMSLKYWQEALSGDLPPLSLQTDRPRQTESNGYGSATTILLDKQLTKKLRALATKQQVPIYTVLLTAFQTLLYRYTDQNDILVGFPKAGRSSSTARLVGYFVNQMVVRANFSDDPSFIDLLNRVDQTLESSSQHDWYPFPVLVQHLQLERELHRSPLIQAVFSWQQAPSLIPRESSSKFILGQTGEEVDFGGLVMRPVNLPYHLARFDLVMLATEALDGLDLMIEYPTDLFDPPTIARLADRYQTLLESITTAPELPVSNLAILPEAEKKLLVEDWNATDAPYPSKLCLHELFEQQVERTPNVIAVASGNDRITYRQLNLQANQLAHYLQEHGIGPNSLVAVFMEPSMQIVKVFLGILKAGGAYLPLDPNNPKERLAFMLADAHPDMLITCQEMQVNLLDFDGTSFIIDTDEDAVTNQPQINPTSEVTPDHPAYVIYTSGSTGQPKGAVLAHRGVVNLLADFQRQQAILPGEACSWWTSPSFDVSVYEIFSPLLAGGSLQVIPENIRLDVASIFEWLQAHQIRSAFLPAFFLEDLLTWIQTHPGASFLRRLLVGVEPISDTLLTAIHTLLPSIAIINGYGPTEATICSTLYRVQNVSPLPGNTPIGRPVANTQIYLLDRGFQPVPIGLVGEVYIGGVGLAHGYLNRPDLTTQRFIQSPFRVGERLYRTGDLARYLPDGNLLFVGRSDTQIKLHGVRIELGEVEASLVQFPGVKQAVVQLHEQTSGGKHLVAYITTSQNPPPLPEELRVYLSQRLPLSMVPSVFIVLDAFPLTTTGKVDRKALPVPEILPVKDNAAPQATQTDVEQILASIWQRILGIENIGRNDNFFELGGDSILSLQIVAYAAEAGLQLKPHQIFQAPTIAELASVAKPAEPIQKSPVQTGSAGAIPLTPIEHWFFQQDFPDPHLWNQSLMFVPVRPLDPVHLRLAVSALLQQHDALRLRFEKDTSDWLQTLSESVDPSPFEVIDVPTLSEAQQQDIIDHQVATQQSNLNITAGPLIRVVYYIFGDNHPGRLLIVIHHLAVDVVSWRILLDDLQRAYLQLESGQPVQLPLKTTDFPTWARHLAEYAQSPNMIHEAGFWQGMIERWKRALLDDPIVPEQISGKQVRESNTRRVSVSLSKEESQALLHQAPEAYRTETVDLLLTALVRTFQHWTQKEAFWINLEAHGREDIFTDIDLSRTVGWFTALYPVCLELPLNTSLDQSIKNIKEQLHHIPNHGLGYGLLRYLNQDPKLNGLFKDLTTVPVSFNYLGQLSVSNKGGILSELAPESPGYQRSPDAHRPHPVDINAAIYHGKLSVEWSYDSLINSRYPIEQVAGTFIDELLTLIAHCLSVKVAQYTPSDFPGADLRQEELDAIVRMFSRSKLADFKRNIEAIYPLSPMQQGMIFHTLYTPESGIYIEQTTFTIQGHFDVSAFERAWQQVLDRHTILRTSFVWQGLDRVLQIVHRDVKAPVSLKDWREIPESEQQDRLKQLLSTERKRGFDLAVPPLLSLDILQTSDDKYTLLLNHHHALLDGWSISLIFEEVFSFYNSITHNQDPVISPAKPYNDYITWLQSQDLAAAETFWRKDLENYVPFRLGPTAASPAPPTGATQPAEQEDRLSISTTTALQELARQHNLTINTLVQGAWAIFLSHHFRRDDILFGVTVSGRSAELPGLLSMIGLFINTLPLRLNLNANMQLLDWLQHIQSKVIEIQHFDYSPLAQIQNWSGSPRNSPLFDTLLVFENYPAAIRAHKGVSNFRFGNIHSIEQTNYPITVAITPGSQLGLRILYDPALFDQDIIRQLLNQLRHVLEGMLSDPNQKLSDLYELTQHEPDGLVESQISNFRSGPEQIHFSPVNKQLDVRIPRKENRSKGEQELPSRTSLEDYLTQQWKKLLNIERIGITDNFFQLGGDSLKAAVLTYQLQDALHEKIPLTAIFENSTILEYAQYLEQNHPTSVTRLFGTSTTIHKPVKKDITTTTIVPIQPQGSQTPLFCIHPAGGIVFPYYTLSSFFDKARPLYGIQDPSLYNNEMDPGSIEAMAERYIEAIKTVQPEDPYNLFGWSAGGVVAYEMAQQLSKQGMRVANLIIVDTGAPSSDAASDHHHRGDGYLHRFPAWIKTLPIHIQAVPSAMKPITSYIRSGLFLVAASSKQDGIPSDGKLTLSSLLDWVGLDTWRALLLRGDTEIVGTVSQETSLLLIRMPAVRRIMRLIRIHRRLVRQYKATCYQGNITLVCAVDSNSEQNAAADPTLGWGSLAEDGVKVHSIQANHVGLFVKPHVKVLARELKTCLNSKE